MLNAHGKCSSALTIREVSAEGKNDSSKFMALLPVDSLNTIYTEKNALLTQYEKKIHRKSSPKGFTTPCGRTEWNANANFLLNEYNIAVSLSSSETKNSQYFSKDRPGCIDAPSQRK